LDVGPNEPRRTGNRTVSTPLSGFRSSGVEGGSPTVYRSWTVPSNVGFGVGVEEPVLGLRDLLRSVGLSSFREVIEGWCKNEGAAFLSDIAGDAEVEALVDTLRSAPGVTASACQRLSHALQAVTDSGNETVAEIGGKALPTCGSPGNIGSSRNLPCVVVASSLSGCRIQGGRSCSLGCRKHWKLQPTFFVEERRQVVAQPHADPLAEHVGPLCGTEPAATLRKIW